MVIYQPVPSYMKIYLSFNMVSLGNHMKFGDIWISLSVSIII